MPVQCMLCAQEAEFIGVGECNHEPICYRCTYKMRVISKNNQCPICKLALKTIVVVDAFAPFLNFKNNLIPDKNFADIFYVAEDARAAFEKLTEYKCFIKIDGKACKFDKKFPSVAFLKKHLKEDHNRYVCEICVEKKTCVLEEQRVYTFKALGKHLEKGDIDEFGNVTFMHPYCKFCNKHYFDEDEFRRHVNVEHILCNVCGKQQKYRYYKHYDSLEVHYKISHYICNDENCLAKKFIAFKNAEELRLHRLQMHDKGNYSGRKIDIKELCGFQYEGHNPDDEIIIIKDKEGVDMEDQFLNLKKCKNKALGEADQQADLLLDPRIFYDSRHDEEELFEEAFLLRHRTADERPHTQQQQRRKKYVEKTELEREKPAIARENESFYFEDLSFAHFYQGRLGYEEFEAKLKTLLSNEEVARFNGLRAKLNKKQVKPAEFLEEFLRLMRNVSLRSAYLVFPHFVRTVANDDLKEELNAEFVRALKKLPSRTDSLLNRCEYYSDLFRLLIAELEANIEGRIRSHALSIKKPVRRCKERLFQIMGVVRRLKIEEMAKFKFASNFGIHKDTVEYILTQVFRRGPADLQQRLDKIETEELLDAYIFVKFCFQVIKHSKNMLTEKNKIHENILEDFLFERPYLEQEFGLKKSELKNLEEQIEFEKLQEEKKAKQTLKEIEKKHERNGYQVKTDFNLVDKGDFPDLLVEKRGQDRKEDNLKEVIQIVKDKPATYQKKINEMFPTLGDAPSPAKEDPKPEQPTKPQPQQAEKAWWEKINDTKKIEVDEEEQVRVKGKGKKKEKWVSVKGVFN